MGIDGKQIYTPHTLKTTAVSLQQIKMQHIAWLLGLVGVTIAAGSIAASSISRATADIADTTINSTVETVTSSASALTNLNNLDASGTAGSSEQESPASESDASDDQSGLDVAVYVNGGPAEVSINGTEVNVPARGSSRQTVVTDNGNVNVSVTNRATTDADDNSKKSSSSSTFRIKSSSSTKDTTKSVSN